MVLIVHNYSFLSCPCSEVSVLGALFAQLQWNWAWRYQWITWYFCPLFLYVAAVLSSWADQDPLPCQYGNPFPCLLCTGMRTPRWQEAFSWVWYFWCALWNSSPSGNERVYTHRAKALWGEEAWITNWTTGNANKEKISLRARFPDQ